MTAIRDHARQMFPEQSADTLEKGRVIDMSTARDRATRRSTASGIGSRLRQSVRSMASGFNPAGWVPLAAAAAIVLAVAPVLIDMGGSGPGSELVAEQTDLLQGNPAAVSEELGRLGDFQYGFSSSNSEFAQSFRAGMLFVDLVSLSGNPADPRLNDIVDAVVSGYGEAAAIERPEQIDEASLNKVVDNLQSYYSRSGQSAIFVFGQWVESTFLLARLATPDSADGLQQALSGADEVRKLLETGGHLDVEIAEDLATLEALGNSAEMNAESLERAALLLLKLRTRYALS